MCFWPYERHQDTASLQPWPKSTRKAESKAGAIVPSFLIRQTVKGSYSRARVEQMHSAWPKENMHGTTEGASLWLYSTHLKNTFGLCLSTSEENLSSENVNSCTLPYITYWESARRQTWPPANCSIERHKEEERDRGKIDRETQREWETEEERDRERARVWEREREKESKLP